MSRIKLEDTTLSTIAKMSDGNPGAMMAMLEIIKNHDKIDPQAAFGGLGAIMMLDTWEIYGSSIYILYNDKCGKNVRRMLMLMRATQLGIFPHWKLKEMAMDQSRQINLTEEEFKELDAKVCEQLEEFARE